MSNTSQFNGWPPYKAKIMIKIFQQILKKHNQSPICNYNGFYYQHYPSKLKQFLNDPKPSLQMIKFYTIDLFQGDSKKSLQNKKKRSLFHKQNTYDIQIVEYQKNQYHQNTVRYLKWFIKQKILSQVNDQIIQRAVIKSSRQHNVPKNKDIDQFKKQMIQFKKLLLTKKAGDKNKRGNGRYITSRGSFVENYSQPQQTQIMRSQQISTTLENTSISSGYQRSSNPFDTLQINGEMRVVDQVQSSVINQKEDSQDQDSFLNYLGFKRPSNQVVLRQGFDDEYVHFGRKFGTTKKIVKLNEPAQLTYEDYPFQFEDKDWIARDQEFYMDL